MAFASMRTSAFTQSTSVKAVSINKSASSAGPTASLSPKISASVGGDPDPVEVTTSCLSIGIQQFFSAHAAFFVAALSPITINGKIPGLSDCQSNKIGNMVTWLNKNDIIYNPDHIRVATSQDFGCNTVEAILQGYITQFNACGIDLSGGGTGPISGGGGGVPSPPDPLPPTPPKIPNSDDDTSRCGRAKKASKITDSVYNSAAFKKTLDSLRATLPTDTTEKGYAVYAHYVRVYKDDNDHDGILVFDKYIMGSIQKKGSSTGITIPTTTTTFDSLVAVLHTHPPKGYAAQSAVDIVNLMKALLDNNNNYNNYAANFVAASNGSVYAIRAVAPIDLLTWGSLQASIDSSTNGWKKTSSIGKDFENARKYYEYIYINDTANQMNLAYEMAMSAVLSKYGTNVMLMKKDASGNFNPILQNISETKNSKGKVTKTNYQSEGCPL